MSGTGTESSRRGERLVTSAVAEGGVGSRFGLTVEEIESIRGGGQVDGTAIVSLMQHYARAERTVVTHVASKSDMLRARIEALVSDLAHDTFLIPLQVHAITGKYEEVQGNHYTGLVIRRLAAAPISEGDPPPRYSIQYIDPIGRPIDLSIADFTRSLMETRGAIIEGEIDSYRGGLQQARIVNAADRARGHEEDASASIADDIGFYKLEGNDVDCGPMLVYLMAGAARGRELPGLAAAGDLVGLSRNVGRGLRRIFLQDNSGEGALRNIEELGVPELEAVGRVAAPPRGIGAARAKRGGSNGAARRSRTDIPATFRRLDSLARLITGSDVCAAVAFTGDELLIANNSGEVNRITEMVMTFLGDIAKREMSIKEMASDKRLQVAMERIAKDAATELARGKKRLPKGQTEAGLRDQYKPRLLTDIKKLVSSLAREDSKTSNIFSPELKEVLKGQRFQFVPGIDREVRIQGVSRRVKVHAEIAILDHVVKREGIAVADREVSAGKKPLYIGITMLCCRDCHHTVTSLNRAESTIGRAGVKEVVEVVGVRGEHLQEYPWADPAFFADRPDVKAIYDEAKRSGGPYRPGEVMATDSASEPEMDKVAASLLAITEAASTGGLGELSPGATPGNNGGKSADKARE